jgi:hypothetical protein
MVPPARIRKLFMCEVEGFKSARTAPLLSFPLRGSEHLIRPVCVRLRISRVPELLLCCTSLARIRKLFMCEVKGSMTAKNCPSAKLPLRGSESVVCVRLRDSRRPKLLLCFASPCEDQKALHVRGRGIQECQNCSFAMLPLRGSESSFCVRLRDSRRPLC